MYYFEVLTLGGDGLVDFLNNCLLSGHRLKKILVDILVLPSAVMRQYGKITIRNQTELIIVPFLLYKIYPPEIKATQQAAEMAHNELEKIGPILSHPGALGYLWVGGDRSDGHGRHFLGIPPR